MLLYRELVNHGAFRTYVRDDVRQLGGLTDSGSVTRTSGVARRGLRDRIAVLFLTGFSVGRTVEDVEDLPCRLGGWPDGSTLSADGRPNDLFIGVLG